MLKVRRSFRLEVKRQLRLAIASAIGFTIAFGWKEAIFEGMINYVSRIMDVNPDHYLTNTYTAIAMTFLGVLCIFISARLLRE